VRIFPESGPLSRPEFPDGEIPRRQRPHSRSVLGSRLAALALVRRLVGRSHDGCESHPDKESTHHGHAAPAGLARTRSSRMRFRHGLVKVALVPERPEVELERLFSSHAQPVGDIPDAEHGKNPAAPFSGRDR